MPIPRIAPPNAELRAPLHFNGPTKPSLAIVNFCLVAGIIERADNPTSPVKKKTDKVAIQ